MGERNLETTPLHQMNPESRFSELVADYAKYRPSYPAVAIDKILEGLENRGQLVAADIGAGTGISSRLLAMAGSASYCHRTQYSDETSCYDPSIG
ncbi:hypothetical protein [Moorena sp. SIO1G6]|uniref:hypothetical protein n=1 Tax=Moorena sp. SIO1G6 TaxID=2607840 RepID=UPI00257D9969|nr:hypothetical protein [Moorena sp. SIO1G6]